MSLNKAVAASAVPFVLLAHIEWLRRVQRIVSEPYLDEFFHIPQADTFWQGRWAEWDDKITTPPGVYLWSILFSKFVWFDTEQTKTLSPYQLRYTNAVLPYLLMVCNLVCLRFIDGRSNWGSRFAQALSIFTFPLFFFFSGLYYTDVFSALTVMCTYCCWQAGLRERRTWAKLLFQIGHVLLGLLSLTSRQTNIFWVAVFTGGLQFVYTLKQKAQIHDPTIAEAYIEDYFHFILSLARAALSAIPQILLDIWPHVTLLASFALFVVWNGGVVLGDKSNHVATIHLPQVLYIWPFILFFSWPVTLPYLLRPGWLVQQTPRYWLVAMGLVVITAVVHFNTIVHEFLLADNRHYTFYAFKLLRHRPLLWYALVPVYAVSAWLSNLALSGLPDLDQRDESSKSRKGSRKRPTNTGHPRGEGNCLSFLLVWFLSTSLSLITAPLVEPRYFMVPWLLWRLHVVDCGPSLDRQSKRTKDETKFDGIERFLFVIARNSVWIEVLWCMLVNFVTCRLFLTFEFQWPHAPDEVQRFMW